MIYTRRPEGDPVQIQRTMPATKSPAEHELAALIVSSLNLESIKPEDLDPDAALFGPELGLDSIDALEPAWPHAFQVRRAEFDEMLFRHAAATPGVRAHEAVRANAVELGADGVTARATADGVDRTFSARYLVDASGRGTLLGRQLGIVRRDRRHQSAALFAHYRGVERRPGEDDGNISVYRFAQGWIWLIPLLDGITSVGAVCSPEHLRDRRGRNEACLAETLASVPELATRLRGATLCGNLHATGNYSYACTKIAGRRYVMAGDACAFVDPIFSSGVYLAMSGAELAAEVVAGALAQPQREAALQRAYTTHVRRGIDAFSWFIHRFNTDAMRRLFASPRNVWQVEQAIISMLAGDVYRARVRVRLRLFRAIYYATALAAWPTAWRDWRRRVRASRGDFADGTTSQDAA